MAAASNNDAISEVNSVATSGSSIKNGSSSNKHNLHIPNISSVNQQQGVNGKLPGITPPLFTPGGRRLPPIGLSPGGTTTRQYSNSTNSGSLPSNPDTLGSSIWGVLPTNQTFQQQQQQQQQQQSQPQPHNFNQFMSGMRKTGLTPNESNIRLGLTPGGLNNFGFGSNLVPGLSTPGALLNGPITPGLSSLLGITQTPLSLLIPTTSSFLQNNLSHLVQPTTNNSVGPIPESTALGSQVNIPQTQQLQLDQSSQAIVGGLPPSQPQPQQHQQQPVIAQQIHTIPENQSIAFDIIPESKPASSETTNLETDLATTNTTTKKRKNDTAGASNKKPKVTKGKKKEPKSKSKGKNNRELNEDDHQNSLNKAEGESVSQKENGIEENHNVEVEPNEGHLENGDETTSTKSNNNTTTTTTTTTNGTTTTTPTTTKSKNRKNSSTTLTEEDKRKNFLERNRVAASKCRQRKKLLIQKMEEELEFYSNGYRELSAEVNKLRGAILLLKKKHNIQDEIIDGLLLKPNTVPTNVTSIPSTIPTTLNPT